MSGGQLVVLDRSGRDVKRYPLASGLATLGSDHACDIRVMLAAVQPHHATVVVHASQAVVRNVGSGETLVNGSPISVAALRHGDVVTIADRALRWEYTNPHQKNLPSPLAMLPLARRGGRGDTRGRRASGAPPPPRDRAVQLALEMQHRASMPGSTGGKQVAVVQPQRRDTGEPADRSHRASPQTTRRTQNLNTSLTDVDDKSKRKSTARTSPKTLLQNTTKATLWIEQRKTSPRRKTQTPQPPPLPPRRSMPAKKSTPLRLAVLKKAQSARKVKVIKIEAPLTIDHTKQAAIMLMTGHTPRSKLSISPHNQSKSKTSPSFLVKKPSPVRKTPRGKARQSGRRETGSNIGVTPSRGSTFAEDSGQTNRRSSKRSSGNRSVTILEITDSSQHLQNSTIRASNISTRSRKSPKKSPTLPSPKKSAMKDLSKKSMRKTESIKFDLSNLEGHQETNDILVVTNTTQYESDSASEGDMTLHYSETSEHSPSPRRSIHSGSQSRNSLSRSSRMLEKLGEAFKPTASPSKTLTPESPRARKSIRGSLMIQKALGTPDVSDYTRSDRGDNTTVASAFRTRTLSPRSNLESYSVVDLVSLDSNDSKSVYNSADSSDTSNFGTPPNGSTRKTRSTINPTLLGSSTPYVGKTRTTRSKSSSNVTMNNTRSSVSTRRSKSLSTPENKYVSVNSTRVSRVSRSRSRINDSDLLLLDDTEVEDSSPKTSKRSRATKSTTHNASDVNGAHSPDNQGLSTPENRQSPEEARTPVLSIQSLLDSSQSSLALQSSGRGKRSLNQKRKTIGALSVPKRRPDYKSKSLGATVRKTLLRLSGDSGASSDKTDEGAPRPDNEDTVTPKSAVKPTPEAVKNKHSTAKKPQSKRSIIDDLDRSDIVKQLFNSPVKRKLSQSMTEFSRRQLFEDEDDVVQLKRPTRNTIALTGRTLNDSVLDRTEAITPERFVSPIASPGNSPNLSGIRRMFKKNTPNNDLRDVRGVKPLLRPRRSAKNDLSDVRGVKAMFAKSPRNRLTDVRVKETFARSPNNDLRRVSGVKSLFQQNTSPKNDLTDVRGVKRVFKQKSPKNDLRNVSGVKRTLRKTSPKNDLTDVRGVRRMFKQQKQKENYHDVSGVEELFNESNQSANRSETLFDMLVGKPTVRSVYSKTFSTKLIQKPKNRRQKSLHCSIDVTTNNVEEWLEQELQKRMQANKHAEPSTSRNTSKITSKNVTIRELQNLATDTVEGNAPIRGSRTRHSSIKKSASEIYSAHTLPIKKRSLVDYSSEKPKPQLPIKKRAVVHSTPVKGRINLTMNASELGRVSPITAVDKTALKEDHNTSSTRSTQIITDEQPTHPPRARAPRKQQTPKKIDVSKVSPKKSPERQVPPKRATRNRKSTLASSTNSRQHRSSIVITKKAPVMVPKPDENATRSSVEPKEASSKANPKATRATRGKKDASVASPKRKVRAGRTSVVVAKPTPKLKPQPLGKVADKSQTKAQEKSITTRKTTVAVPTLESPKLSPKSKKNIKAKAARNVSKTEQTSAEKPVRGKRGRKVTETEQPVLPKRGRKANVTESSVRENITRASKRAIATISLTEDKQPKSRGKKVAIQASEQAEPVARGRGLKVEPVVEEKQTKTRSKKGKSETKPVVVQTKTRGKKVEATPVEVQTKTRGKQVESETKSQTKTRGKKVEVEARSAEAQTKTRGRKAANETLQPVTSKSRGKNVAVNSELEQVQPRRGRNVEIDTKTEEVATSRRGKKTNVQTAVESEPASRRRNKTDSTVLTETRGRKRKSTAVEEVPSKIPKQAPKRGKKAEQSEETVTESTGRKKTISKDVQVVIGRPEPRSTRGKPKQVEEKRSVEAKPARGRKPAEPKEKVQEATRGKRKAVAEPSPAKVAAKKPATKAAVKAKPSTAAKPTARATRGKAAAVSPKAVGRSRRR